MKPTIGLKSFHALFGLTQLLALLTIFSNVALAQGTIKLATFDVDATPPLGSAMAYDPVNRLDELTLRCRGIVLLGAEQPIVLCAVDWIGIANEGHDAFRAALAEAAGTTPLRVAVHTLHQHDAPGCDFTAEKIVEELDIKGYTRFDGTFHREVIQRAADAIRIAVTKAQPVTHFGYGKAIVKEVASNRRVERLPDGTVGRMRGSSCKIEGLVELPEGLIDPEVSVLSFWNEDQPVAVLSAYACHPQSYYRLGIPSPDFPGIARFIRGQDVNGALHVHFNGAGGNIAAGKYNSGAQPNRMILANRLAMGMREAFETSIKTPLTSANVGWDSVPVSLPLSPLLNEAELVNKLKSSAARGYVSLADQLAWVRRVKSGHQIEITCLTVGNTRMLHLPGELFVEYQLAAKAMRPDLHVMMAAYGDYGPAYIGTAAAYPEGGYETGPTSSNVSAAVEPVLLEAMKKLLDVAPPFAGVKGDWKVVDGAMTGKELEADEHAAVLNLQQPNRNSVVRFSFKFDGDTKGFGFSLNHAKGHLFRVAVTPSALTVSLDKDKNDSESKAIMMGTAKGKFIPGQWYTIQIEMVGERVFVPTDHGLPVEASNTKLDIDKPNYRFVTQGESLSIDDLMIWEAK